MIPSVVGSDDRNYYIFNTPVGNVDVIYGSVPKFAAPKWGKAPVAVAKFPVFSTPVPVEIIN